MKQELNPAVAAVVIVVLLVVVAVIGFKVLGKSGGTTSKPEDNPQYRAYQEGLKKK